MQRVLAVLSAVALLALAGCGGRPVAPAETVLVSVAASLSDVMRTLQPQFAAVHPQIALQFNFGSSGALQQQIEQGAPADLFIAAAEQQVNALVQAGLVERSAVRTLATNSIVLVRPAGGAVRSWDDLKGDRVRRIAIGDPAHVPAGQYGKATLQSLGLWQAVQPKLVMGSDVRQVLDYVAAGEVEAGIVYRTDAAVAPKVQVAAAAPPGSHPPVLYPMAVVRGSRHAAAAQAFADFLLSPAGRAVLEKYGFGGAD